MKPKIKPPRGYRLLRPNEIARKGDMWRTISVPNWVEVMGLAGSSKKSWEDDGMPQIWFARKIK